MYPPPLRRIVEDYEVVEQFEAIWDNMPKNTPLTNNDTYDLYLEVQTLRVFVRLAVSVKGGISETVLVFDTTQRITSDRLLLNSTYGGITSDGVLLPLRRLRAEVYANAPKDQRKEFVKEACLDAMWDFIDAIIEEPLTPEGLRQIKYIPPLKGRLIPVNQSLLNYSRPPRRRR